MTNEQVLMGEQTSRSSIWTTGLALFSMFFGAGNLIFPLIIGQDVGANSWYALSGLGMTAVIVPFLGLGGMLLFQADPKQFFGRIGKIPGLLLFLMLQLILGPFGVIPRLIVLMHAIAKPYLFNTPLMLFSALIAFFILSFSIKKQFLITFLGKILTPILLLGLLILMALGIGDTSAAFNPISLAPQDSFLQGLIGGYNTMDLIAAFLFATVMLPHFQKEVALEHPVFRQKAMIKKMIFSSTLAASLLLLTYIGLCFTSAYHTWTLANNPAPEELLSAIAFKVLGKAGGCVAAGTVIMACLTTAITLTSIFGEYLQKDICRNKINSTTALVITLIIAMLFANLGFKGLSSFLGPILEVTYPGLIVLSILNIAYKLTGFKMIKTPVFLTFAISAVAYFLK